MKYLCYGCGLDKQELLVKNGKKWTRDWRSCRGQIKVVMYEEKRRLHIEKSLLTFIKLYNETKLNMCNK